MTTIQLSKNILKLGNGMLKQIATPFTKEELKETTRIEKILDVMVREMRENNGCGIAAPQIGISKQLFIFELNCKEAQLNCPNFPLTAFFNPTIEIVEDDYPIIPANKQRSGSSRNLLNLTRFKRSLQSPSSTTPKLMTPNNTIDLWESCLSVPNYFGKVTRARRCIVKFQDITGAHRAIEADGIISSCLQHENDHLLGRIFIERLRNGLNDLVFFDEMTTEQNSHIFNLTGDFQITK